MPSNSTGKPKVNRSAPLPGSRPTVAMARPMDMLNNAFSGELPTKLVIRHMPSTATMNSSGAPNSSASFANGATRTKPRMPMQPPTKEASAAITSACPPRPLRAIW